MANFFWIGNAANWATTNWSSSSGGASNGLQPTSADDVIFDANSPGNCTVTVSTACRSLDFRGGNPDSTHDFAHTFKINSGIILTQGTSTSNGTLGLRLSPSMTLTFASQTSGGFTFASTSGTVEQITTNGKSMATTVFNGAGGSWQLQDNFSAAGAATTKITLTAGTLDLNGVYVTAGTFVLSGSTTRSLSFNGATVELQAVSGNCWNATSTGLTLSAANGAIYVSGAAAAVTFIGGGQTYGALTVTLLVNLTITGSNTFGVWTTYSSVTINVTAGTTQTISGFAPHSPTDSVIFLSTVNGSTYTLQCAAGVVLGRSGANQVTDCIASGGIPFYAGNGATLTNTTHWVASSPFVLLSTGTINELPGFAGNIPGIC